MRALRLIDPVLESNYHHEDFSEYARDRFYEFILTIGRYSYKSRFGDIADLLISCSPIFLLRIEMELFE